MSWKSRSLFGVATLQAKAKLSMEKRVRRGCTSESGNKPERKGFFNPQGWGNGGSGYFLSTRKSNFTPELGSLPAVWRLAEI